MKNSVLFPVDFSALTAEILAAFESEINADTVAASPPKAIMLAKSTTLSLTPSTYPPLEDFPAIASTMEGTNIEVYSLFRRVIANATASIYTSLTYDTILIPMSNCDNCTLHLYEAEPDAVLINTRFPEGIAPTHGNYKTADCSLIEAIPFTSPIFIRAKTAWMVTTAGEGNAHALAITTSTGPNDSYFE